MSICKIVYRAISITILIFFFCQVSYARVKYDSQETDISSFFNTENTTYIIRNTHKFKKTISIPHNSELFFQGGALQGPIVFNETKLSGGVNLKGSTLSGTITNSTIEADWLCYKDGIHDDANNINMMIEVCGNIHFGSGVYRLISSFKPPLDMHDYYRNMITCHIGIHRSNVSLIGEPGAVFFTKEPLGVIFAYTIPRNIDGSISCIKIKGLSFQTENNGKDFHETLHTIKSIGINDFVVEDCRFNDFWGDAICLGHYGDNPGTGELIRNSNVVVRNNIIIGGKHHNTRNGVSVCNGFNVLIEHNYIKNCSRKDMPGAIDIEANNSAFTVRNITVSNNIIEDCGGTAGGICVNANDRGGEAHNIKILYNSIKNCSYGLAFVVQKDYTTDAYLIQGNVVDSDTQPYIFVGSGKSSNWIIIENIFKRNTSAKIPGNIKVSNFICNDNIVGKDNN